LATPALLDRLTIDAFKALILVWSMRALTKIDKLL